MLSLVGWRLAAHALTVVHTADAVDPWSSLVQYGPLGLMVLGFVTGWIVPGPTAKRLETENARLQKLIEEELLPLARSNATSDERVAHALEESARALTRVADQGRA